MVQIEELLEQDLAAASQTAAELIPDIVAALDRLATELVSGARDRAVVRRYWLFAHEAARVLIELPARDPEALPPSDVVLELLRRNVGELPWVAPSADGIGLVTALVDRLRGLAAGLPQQCVQAGKDIDEQSFAWFTKSMAEVEYEQERGSPLRRAMTTLDLASSDVARLMGVKRQAVDKWLIAGPPADRCPKIAAVAEIADILRHRLRKGLPAAAARRPADAYGGMTMLELIEADEHEWLLRSVKESFDYARVA